MILFIRASFSCVIIVVRTPSTPTITLRTPEQQLTKAKISTQGGNPVRCPTGRIAFVRCTSVVLTQCSHICAHPGFGTRSIAMEIAEV